MRRFVANPEACTQSGNPVVRDLIKGWGNEGWSALDEYLVRCIEQALTCDGPILECGSGLSTLLVGAIAKKRGLKHWALEHTPVWAARVRRSLTEHRIDSVVLCDTPIKDFGDFAWYDAPLATMPARFAFVICDGPPSDTKAGRYGLGPVMKDRFGPGTVILLDDAEREDERAVARRWQGELNADLEMLGSAKPYIRLTVRG